MALLVVCSKPGCTVAVPHGASYCRLHIAGETKRREEAERKRKRNSVKSPEAYEASRFYATARWHTMRLVVLNDEPLCRLCMADGTITPATVVDHVRRHNNDASMFFCYTNLQALCKPCHDVKTMTVDYAQRLIDRKDTT